MPSAGQFVVSLGTGHGIDICGPTGAVLTTGGIATFSGYAFNCSWWDSGTLYLAFYNATTHVILLASYTASGSNIWGGNATTTITGVGGSVTGCSGIAVIGSVLYVAVPLPSGTVAKYYIYRVGATGGNQGTFIDGTYGANLLVPWMVDKAGGGSKQLNVFAGLKFSTNPVNVLGVMGNLLGVECPGSGLAIFSAVDSPPAPTVAKYAGTTSTSQRSRVVSDGYANFYTIASVTTGKIAKVGANGAIAWQATGLDANGPQDIWYDDTGPNFLIAVQAASPSANALALGNGTIIQQGNPLGLTSLNNVGSDGAGNFTFWRSNVGTANVGGTSNNLTPIWGPTAFANANNSGAMVNPAFVSAGPNVITITTPADGSTVHVTSGVFFSLQIVATDSDAFATLIYEVQNLPSGLGYDSNSGRISQTTTQTGSKTVTVIASDATGSTASITCTFKVDVLSTAVTVNPISDVSMAFSDSTAFDVSATDTQAGQTISWGLTFSPDGVFISSSSISSTGQLTAHVTLSTGATGPPGTITATVTATDNNSAVGTATFLIRVGNRITVANPGNFSWVVNTAHQFQLAATDSDSADTTFTWSDGGTLPPPMSINSSTGLISGTPNATGTYTVTATATDTQSTVGSVTFIITITPVPPDTVTITAPGTESGLIGSMFSLQLIGTDSSGLPLTWSASGLPAGLLLSTTGLLSGLPAVAGLYTPAITAQDSTGGYETIGVPITIAAPQGAVAAFSVFSTAEPGYTGIPATPIALAATDTLSNPTFTWKAANLPPGLTIDAATGIITGTPTASGNYTVVATATDQVGNSGNVIFPMQILPPTTATSVTVTNPGNQTTNLNATANLQIVATDSNPALTATLRYSATGLPNALSINSSGLISGTARTGGSYTVTVTVSDTSGSSGSATFAWVVSGPKQTKGGTRQVIGLVVAGGEIRTFDASGSQAVTGGPGALSSFAPVVFSAPLGGQMFYVDGVNYAYYDPNTNAVKKWAATAGTMPVDNKTLPGRLIATWNGRLVVSGLPFDGQNWFMSAQSNAFDFDYSPATTTTTMAVAGNSSPAGTIGEIVTCLIPYTDDVLILGCTHSIWQMVGDPADGGQLTAVSQHLGIAWGRPFAIDPVGQIYFMGNDRGIYKMVPGALPVRISQQINSMLLPVDLTANIVRMVWDTRNQGLAVFITPYAATLTTHFFWEQRTNSWWPMTHAVANLDPMAMDMYEGDSPADNVVLLGSRDGYMRQWSENAVNDDGSPIGSSIMLGPLMTSQLDTVLLKELHATLAADSGPVTWAVYVGPTAEVALASAPVARGTWAAGRNRIESIRRAGIQVYLQLSSVGPWALERINARFAPMGRVRQRGVQ